MAVEFSREEAAAATDASAPIARSAARRAASAEPRQPGKLFDRALARYGLAVATVAVAVAVTFAVQLITGKPLAFPFYAAVVISAWFGVGPGLFAFALSALAVEDIATPPLFDLAIDARELPSFVAFLMCAFMSLAWAWQRRRAQSALETTVRQRTADLLRANAALQAEIVEREAAQDERDRTEQALRQAEGDLARALRLATVAELAATIAHEINQPLAAITANGGACLRSLDRDPPLLENAREAAGCIVSDGHRAADVIARIRALFNKEPPRKRQVDINETIRHVLELSRAAIERERIAVDSELANPAPVVLADVVQLQQVLINLVTNALEAMAATTGRARVLSLRSVATDEGVTVTVEDTGPGFDPAQVDRFFDGFYTTKPDGIGLGLAISRSIIEAHGGSMSAKPGSPFGASFGFALPSAANRQSGEGIGRA